MISFPESPAVDDIFSYGALSWQWDGEKWTSVSTPTETLKYIVGCFVPGVPVANQVMLSHPVARDITIPAGFADYAGFSSHARSTVAATASTTFKVQRNGTDIGTIVFAAGGSVGTFATSGDVAFADGDLLLIVAPATPDAALFGFSATIVGHA